MSERKKFKRLAVGMNDAEYERTLSYCDRDGLTFSEYVRRALYIYLKTKGYMLSEDGLLKDNHAKKRWYDK